VIVNGYLWRHQLDDLFVERRCIAVDLLGHGRTEVKNLSARITRWLKVWLRKCEKGSE
jgi:pimeloyl-ACP methyl ester carboxylesterase